MNTGSAAPAGSTLRDVLRVLRRRKWVVLVMVAVVTATAVAVSLRRQELYRASGDVLISHQDLAASLTGTATASIAESPERVIETQVRLAREPSVAARVVNALGPAVVGSVGDVLDVVSVSADPTSDILTFRATEHDPALAVRLADEYAKQFTLYRRDLDTGALKRARQNVVRQIDILDKRGDRRGPLYVSLLEKAQQLSTLEVLHTSHASVVRRPDGAVKVQPRPVRDGLLGLGLGLVLGLGLAFLREVLDTRVRTEADIGSHLGLPLLARIPEPPRHLRRQDRLVMLEQPASGDAEPFRMLRTGFELVTHDRALRTVMFTSATASEGKSTTVANLAVALARAGKSVALVDLDLHNPALARLFGVAERPGLTEVALGRHDLDEALVRVPIARAADVASLVWMRDMARATNGDRRTNGDTARPAPSQNGKGAGSLVVLPSGMLPPNPGEFVATKSVREILQMLGLRADIVLVDTPPALHLGDAITLAGAVDAIVAVVRISVARRPMLGELERILVAAPAAKLGFVVTGAEAEDGYAAYGYAGYRYREPRFAGRLPDLAGTSAGPVRKGRTDS